MYFIRGACKTYFTFWENRACTEEQRQARLYDPEEAILILLSATASSAG